MTCKCEGEPTCRTCAYLDERTGEEALVAYHGRRYAKYLLDRMRVAEEKLARIEALCEKWERCARRSRDEGEWCDCEDFAPDLRAVLNKSYQHEEE